MNNRIFSILVLVFLHSIALGQNAELDSLQRVYDMANSPADKIELAIEMGLATESKNAGLAYATAAEELASDQSKKLKIKAANGSASIYYKYKDFQIAAEKMQVAVEWLEESGSDKSRADAYYKLAKCYRRALQPDKALSNYRKAEELYTKLDEIPRLIDCINKQGIIHKDLDNYSEALPIYHKAYELARTKGLPTKLAATSVNIGVVLKNQRNYDEALNYYHKAEEIYLIENNYSGLANIYNNIGNVLRYQKKLKKALEYYDLSLENREKSNDKQRMSYAYNNIGIVYTEQKKYQKALENLEKSEKLKIEFGDLEMLAGTYLNISEVYLEKNLPERYYYYADLAEKLGRKYLQTETVRNVIVNNGRMEAKNGNYKKAYAHLSSVFDELDTLDVKEQKILASVLEAHFRAKQSKSEISELSEANDTLSSQKEELEYNQNKSRKLIWALSGALLLLALIFILLLIKQSALSEKKKELELTNETLRKTKLGEEEKETLLKEIHHRVKNNLQIIKSLIRLQKSTMDDEVMKDILLEFEQRVSSMALVHESLYKSDDLAHVNVNNYYEDLIKDLINAYNVEQEVEAQLTIDIDNLGLDTLVPLGLLTNEIISNSLKHGFETSANGIIKVDLKRINDERYELFIGDNGKGFDFEQQKDAENSLGTELIVALIEQLDGEYEFNNESGAHYKITFKPQDKTRIK